jgi:type IV secretory pathway TrbD component
MNAHQRRVARRSLVRMWQIDRAALARMVAEARADPVAWRDPQLRLVCVRHQRS